MIEPILASLGAGDCERLLDGPLVQPVNAWTSLAYTVVGLALIVTFTASRGRERTYRVVFGVLLALTGIGSFLYHGPQSSGAGFAHDITFLAALWFLVSIDLGPGLGRPARFTWSLFAGLTAGTGAILLAFPTVTNLLTGVAVVALIVSDVTLRRRGGTDGRLIGIALGLFAVSLVSNVLGRTGGPFCSPGSLVQYHAFWHTLSAMALGAYYLSTVGPRTLEETPRDPAR
jgi:hypothetical protein